MLLHTASPLSADTLNQVQNKQDAKPEHTFHDPEMSIAPFPGRTASRPHSCFQGEQTFLINYNTNCV